MDPIIADVTQMISTVGFPIAASVGMFYLYNKTVTGLTETLTSINHTLTNLNNMIINEVVRKERGE